MSKTIRQTNIEVLKVIAIIMIILCHCMPTVSGNSPVNEIEPYLFDLSVCSYSMLNLLMVFIKYGGQLGNAIFIVCTAWFLQEDLECKKYNLKRVINITLKCTFVSVGILFVYIIYDMWGGDRPSGIIPITILIKQFFPIMFENNWYITCYILFYLLLPGINKIIGCIKRRTYFYVCIILFVMYNVINFLVPGRYYYSNLVGFICIYLYVGFMKLYLYNLVKSKKINICILIFSVTLFILSVLMTNYIGLKINVFCSWLSRWNTFMNPLILGIAVSLFNIFYDTKIKSCSIINSISNKSLLIYIIHCNYLLMNYVKFDCYKYIYENFGYKNLLFWMMGFAFSMFGGSYITALIFDKMFVKCINHISNVIYELFTKILEYIYKFFAKNFMQ